MKYEKDFHPAELVRLMKEGATVSMVASKFNVSRKQLYVWRDKYPEMAEAFEMGETHARALYDQQLDEFSRSPAKEANAALFIWRGKLRFPDTRSVDKTVIEGGDPDKPVRTESKVVATDWLNELAAAKKEATDDEADD